MLLSLADAHMYLWCLKDDAVERAFSVGVCERGDSEGSHAVSKVSHWDEVIKTCNDDYELRLVACSYGEITTPK